MDIDPENNMAERDAEVSKIFKVVDVIINQANLSEKITGEREKGIFDLDLSNELSGVLMTVYTCLRKEVGDQPGFARYKTYTVSVGEKSVSIQAIIDAVKAQDINLSFEVATPIVEIMTLFRSSYDEVRTGVSRFRVRSSVAKRGKKRDASGRPTATPEAGKSFTQTITQYGLNMHHIPLLRGITFAPERRTGAIKTLGPLSQAIMTVMEDKYFDKLHTALLYSIQMLPMARDVITCLKEAKRPGSVSGIMKELGDILIMSTPRSTQKFYFPLTFISYLWVKKPTGLSWSYSGSTMLKYYTDIVGTNSLKFKIKSGGDEIRTSQVVFHSIFGTYLDDLDICSQITSHSGKWFQRKDLNPVFQKRSEASAVEFVPITFKYVLKMAQALFTKSLGNIDTIQTCRPSFSGVRKRAFSSEFLSYLRAGKSQNFSSDPIQLLYSLRKTKDQIMKDLETIKLLKAGTSKWEMKVESAWVESTFEATEGSSKFFGM